MGLCHNFRRNHRQHHRRQSPTNITDRNHTSQSARLSDTLSPTELSAVNVRRSFSTEWPTNKNKKAAFSKILVRISIYFRRKYRRKLMPPTTINVPSVILTEILAYKPPPHLVHFLLALISISSPPDF